MTAGDDGRERTANPRRGTAEPAFVSGDTTLPPAPAVEHGVHPVDCRHENRWHDWKPEPTDDDSKPRKIPRAPYLNSNWPDRYVNAQDPEVWTDFETAYEWAEKLPNYGVALNIRDRDEFPDEDLILIDYDNARNPDTGEIHPTVREHLVRANSYGDVSVSYGGAHILVRGTLPDGVKTIEDTLPPAEGFPEAEIEVYDTKRFVAMSGAHIVETPTETHERQEFLEELADEYATTAEETPDELVRDPVRSAEELADVKTTSDIQDVFDTIQHTGPGDISLQSPVTEERADGSTSRDPSWANSASGTRLAEVDNGWVYRKGMHGLDALQVVALEEGIISHVEEYPQSEEFWTAVNVLRNRGAHIPEYTPASGEGAPAPSGFDVKKCTPPERDASEVNLDALRARIRGEDYDAVRAGDGPGIQAHVAGAGKSTNDLLGSLARDRPRAHLTQRHDTACEQLHKRGEVYPAEWDPYHLKGGGQPRHDCCMDAKTAADSDQTPACPTHGTPSEWPHMCAVYDLAHDHEQRQLFKAIAAETDERMAHLILGDDLHGHEDGECTWLAQFDAAAAADHLLGVHEYQTLKTVQQVGDTPRDVVIDEAPRTLVDSRRVTVEDLIRASNALADVAGVQPRNSAEQYTLQNIAAFARDIANALTDPGGDADLATLEPPEIVATAYETYNDAAGNHVAYEQPDEPWQAAEALARARLTYNETIVSRMRRDEWTGAPLIVDALLAASIEAGLDAAPVRQAIAVPSLLEQCPRCSSDLTGAGGADACSDCEWHKTENTLIQPGAEHARVLAHLDVHPETTEGAALVVEQLPLVSDLPDDPVVLDATATPGKVAALYGADVGEVTVVGDEPLALNMHVTQTLNGQYHGSTILNAVKEDRPLADCIQQRIDQNSAVNERPLFVGKKDVLSQFNFPENAVVMHYHATRGVDRARYCDAVVLIGAPHPNIDDIQRQAELLAQGRDDIRVGGEEYNTRRDADGNLAANPPVYRQLYYEDDQGDGRAVPTKHFSGLVGELFREAREKEMVQAVHRARPLLADDDEPVHVEILSNVPTSLPVDEVCTLDKLAEPLAAQLPVPDGALDLFETINGVATGRDAPDGFRAAGLLEQDGDGGVRFNRREVHRLARLSGVTTRTDTAPSYKTVSRWVEGLEDLGLVSAGEYESRTGVRFSVASSTLTSALTVIHSNASVKVAAVRRFRALAEAADGSLRWLRWAREALELTGDRCEWDPPPQETSAPHD